MKILQKSIVVVATMLSLAALTIPASADTRMSSSVITIKATVLPASYVIADPAGNVIKIFSNTTADVTPKVYVQSVAPDHAECLTPQIYEQYRTLVPAGTNHAGVIYDRAHLTALQVLTHSHL